MTTSNVAKKIELIPFKAKVETPSGIMTQIHFIQHGMKCLKELGHLLAALGMIGEYAFLLIAWFNQRTTDSDVLVFLCVTGLALGLGGTILMMVLNLIAETVLGKCADQDIQTVLGTKVAQEATMEELRDMLPKEIFNSFANYSLDDRAYQWRNSRKKI